LKLGSILKTDIIISTRLVKIATGY